MDIPLLIWEQGLNPCFGGIYSRRNIRKKTKRIKRNCLNPCFGGIYSRSCFGAAKFRRNRKGLNPCFGGIYSRSARNSWSKICRWAS